MLDDGPPDDDSAALAAVLGNVLKQSANESLVMAQLEARSYFSPMPASLPLGDGTPLDEKLDRLSEALGGPPRLIVVGKGEETPRFDTYSDAAIRECVTAFMRARTSVCRTHLYLIGSALLMRHPETMNLPDDPNISRILVSQVEERFWEHAETSFIRLASFFDRLGQILDFAFFRIRQYERDGFSAVLDRIRSNAEPMTPAIRESLAWQRLRRYQASEQPDGLKWLLRRRNLLVHSLHLDATTKNESANPIFLSAYNHLDESVRTKLRPGTQEEELNHLHQHLRIAASHFADVAEVALIGASGDRPA